MNTSHFSALATKVPMARYSQQQIFDQFIAFQEVSGRRAEAMEKIFHQAGVGFRHLVVPADYFLNERTTQDRNEIYMKEAVLLGQQAISLALKSADCTAHDIDDFIVVSCTGFSIPGLDLHLASQLGMRSDLRRTCILGMGCYAAFPAINRAAQAVQANPNSRTLVLCVELCSLHMQKEDTAENVVSSALFSDGAAAVILDMNGHAGASAASDQQRLPRIIDSATSCDYETLEHMSFSLTDHGFRMYLSSYVPDLLSSHVKAFVDDFLKVHDLSRQQISHWGIHPGSTKIVDYVQDELALTDDQVAASRHVLHEYGNMSSVTILFVLEQISRHQQPEEGAYGMLLAFGPGLTMETMLVQW